MPSISNLIGRVDFPLIGEDVKNVLLEKGVPDCDVCLGELPDHDGVDILYIDQFSDEYRWRICQIVMNMFDVFDHHFESNNYPIPDTVTTKQSES